jgi:hypothetical protein
MTGATRKLKFALVGIVLACLCVVLYKLHDTREAKQIGAVAIDKKSVKTADEVHGSTKGRIELHDVRETRTASSEASRYVGYAGKQRYIIKADDDCLVQGPDDARQALAVLKKKGLSGEAGSILERELMQTASQPIFLVHSSKSGWWLLQGKESCGVTISH